MKVLKKKRETIDSSHVKGGFYDENRNGCVCVKFNGQFPPGRVLKKIIKKQNSIESILEEAYVSVCLYL